MSLIKTEKARRVWKCDICGKEDYWGPGWRQYSSILDEDLLRPEDIPTVCSDECMQVFEGKRKSGEITVPKFRVTSGGIKESGKRKGY